jgi:hypothetical protein
MVKYGEEGHSNNPPEMAGRQRRRTTAEQQNIQQASASGPARSGVMSTACTSETPGAERPRAKAVTNAECNIHETYDSALNRFRQQRKPNRKPVTE